jgi:hypothetical protein
MKTIILLLNDRKLLEKVENQVFKNSQDMLDQLKEYGMTQEDEDNLGYYTISDFMDLVNDQLLDNLENTFLGYVRFNL